MNLKNLSMNSFLHYLEKLFLMLGIPGGLEPQNEYIASIHFRYFSRVSSDSRGSGLKFHFRIVFGVANNPLTNHQLQSQVHPIAQGNPFFVSGKSWH